MVVLMMMKMTHDDDGEDGDDDEEEDDDTYDDLHGGSRFLRSRQCFSHECKATGSFLEDLPTVKLSRCSRTIHFRLSLSQTKHVQQHLCWRPRAVDLWLPQAPQEFLQVQERGKQATAKAVVLA